jgi:hypothetical protein
MQKVQMIEDKQGPAVLGAQMEMHSSLIASFLYSLKLCF